MIDLRTFPRRSPVRGGRPPGGKLPVTGNGSTRYPPQPATIRHRPDGLLLILIADDHALVREGLRYALRDLTPEVRFQEASDAMQVRALIERSPDVDLLLLDLVMPGSNGFELLTELCQRRPELPVVVLSGSEDPVHMRKALDLGAAGFIPKTSSKGRASKRSIG